MPTFVATPCDGPFSGRIRLTTFARPSASNA
jgi:hypothetical protein